MLQYFGKTLLRFLIGSLITILVIVFCVAIGLVMGYGISSDNIALNVFNADLWQKIMSFSSPN